MKYMDRLRWAFSTWFPVAAPVLLEARVPGSVELDISRVVDAAGVTCLTDELVR
jgi:hypothetical protein